MRRIRRRFSVSPFLELETTVEDAIGNVVIARTFNKILEPFLALFYPCVFDWISPGANDSDIL